MRSLLVFVMLFITAALGTQLKAQTTVHFPFAGGSVFITPPSGTKLTQGPANYSDGLTFSYLSAGQGVTATCTANYAYPKSWTFQFSYQGLMFPYTTGTFSYTITQDGAPPIAPVELPKEEKDTEEGGPSIQ